MSIDVAQLYERFPFPSPAPDLAPIDVVARELPFVLRDADLTGQRILDAGCGTGHTLIGLAARYPGARFVGVDACLRSLDIAHRLAEHNGVANVEFVRGTMPDLDPRSHPALRAPFDLVICFGVLHHLPEPRAGLTWLRDRLGDGGLLHLWLYHAVGEHRRLLDRELVRLLAAGQDPAGGLETVRRLGLSLSLAEYGFPTGWTGTPLSQAEQDVFDADAYLNPIVRPMRFGDLPDLLAGLGFGWLAADRIYGPDGVPFIDLAGVEPAEPGRFIRPEDLITDPVLRERLRALSNADRLRALEVMTRPTGFRVLAGCGTSLARCTRRVAGNLIPLRRPVLAAPGPGTPSAPAAPSAPLVPAPPVVSSAPPAPAAPEISAVLAASTVPELTETN